MTEPTIDVPAEQRRALLLAELSSRVARFIKANKAELMGPGGMTPGQTNRPSIDIDGHKTQAGTVAYTDPETKAPYWVESDPVAHVAWVDRTHPTEVEVIERVRPAFTSGYRVLNGEVVDADGTIVEGCTVVYPPPTEGHIRVTPAKDERIAAELWRMIRDAPAEILPAADDE